MGCPLCTEEKEAEESVTKVEVESTFRPQAGSWNYANLSLSDEPGLRLFRGLFSCDIGDELGMLLMLQYDGRTPAQELGHLLANEATVYAKALRERNYPPNTIDFPEATTEDEGARLLDHICSGHAQLWDGVQQLVLPKVSKGIEGKSPLHVASMPYSDNNIFNDVLLFCLEEQVGFGVVWQGNWCDLWFCVWKLRQREAVADLKELLVLTKDDGSIEYSQSIEVMWLQQQGISFKHMRAKSFLLQVRPLVQAAMQQEHEMAVQILSEPNAGCYLQQLTAAGFTAAHAFARDGDLQLLGQALEAGLCVDEATFRGSTLLHLASTGGHDISVRLLLQEKAELERIDGDGRTPLFLASDAGHEAVVWELLSARAEVDRAFLGCATPLFIASERGHEESVLHLIKARADVEMALEDDDETFPLFMASDQGHEAVVLRLLAARALLERPVRDGRTCLFQACQLGHSEVVYQLLGARASVEAARTDNGGTPLLVATEYGHENVVGQLLDARADAEHEALGWTPLALAGHLGHFAVAQVLLEATGRPGGIVVSL